jgi:hypothetical protein
MVLMVKKKLGFKIYALRDKRKKGDVNVGAKLEQ